MPLTDEEARDVCGDERAIGRAESYSGDAEEAVTSLRRALRGLAVERVETE